jgi:2,4-dienoyl-CoA reductase-like NADH-dependent reductase (Old Yellow Enzyme family)/thioredoxin reductase
MLSSLFSPLTVNGMILKNRIVAAPTGDLFEEKALGGAALVVAGHSIVEPGKSSFASADEPWPFEKYERESTRHRVLKIHQAGAKASIEVFHGGQDSRVIDYAKGPCSFIRPDGFEVKAMNEPMMEETLNWYGKTAAACRKIGFDSILLHFGHGWLADQFLSPFYNHRNDQYGGCLENRARFPLRILDTVRKAVGPHFPIDMRVSAYEWVEGSIEFSDVVEFIKMAEPYIDMVQVSSGIDKNKTANVHCITTNVEEFLPNLDWAREVKRSVAIPVSVVGAIPTPVVADKLIADGDVDLVYCGRSLIADPYWPKKAMEGRLDDITPCLRCNNCYHIASDHWNVGCSVNPRYHNESFVAKDITKAHHSKRVVVIGGGPAGMKAAITAYDRGHKVTLIERKGELGGLLRFVAQEAHKKEVSQLLGYLCAQIKKRNIDVRFHTHATPDVVRSLDPEAIVIAIGANERRLNIPGLDGPKVLLGTEALSKIDSIGQKVVILGGGSVGCEIALELAEIGKDITVLEMAKTVAANANSLYREALRQKFELHENLHIVTEANCDQVTDQYALYKSKDGKRHELFCDNLVVSVGLVPKTDEVQGFYGITPNTASIGDCTHPSNIMNAIFEGYTFALNL